MGMLGDLLKAVAYPWLFCTKASDPVQSGLCAGEHHFTLLPTRTAVTIALARILDTIHTTPAPISTAGTWYGGCDDRPLSDHALIASMDETSSVP